MIVTCHSVADHILLCGFFSGVGVIFKSVHDPSSMAVKHRCLPLDVSFSKVTNNSKKGRALELSSLIQGPFCVYSS